MEMIERIYKKAKETNISISTLEKKADLSNGQIGKWKIHNQKPSYDKVYAIANTLNVSIDWLITGKEPEDLSPEEKILVDKYRACSSVGKERIQQNADDMTKLYPALPEGVSAFNSGKTGTNN